MHIREAVGLADGALNGKAGEGAYGEDKAEESGESRRSRRARRRPFSTSQGCSVRAVAWLRLFPLLSPLLLSGRKSFSVGRA